MKELTGKKVVVIGGSRGTGLAIVEALLKEGASVLVVARGTTSLTALTRTFPQVRTLKADAANAATSARIFEGSPDVVVLAAGAIPPTRPVHRMDWTTFSKNWNTDVQAAFHLAQYALTTPVKPGTKIIFISSGAAILGSPISGGYAGSKRMQMFLANYAQETSNRLQLDLRFLALGPWRLMDGTGTGEVVTPEYANYFDVPVHNFVAMMTAPQTKEDVAGAVAAFAGQTPAVEEGNVFIVSGKGVVPEANVQQVLLGKN
ncbi:MAG TPA: SDR family oxidoreductase [Puia sp.]|nr:SDR family oxidoreductase [Puia sp.]